MPTPLAKAFSPNSISVGGVSTLTFTLTNLNAGTALNGVAFTDTLPAGLNVAATPNVTTTGCGAPAFAPSAGSKVNTTGSVTSTNAGTGNISTSTLTANPPGIPIASRWGLMLLALLLAAVAAWRLSAS